MVDLAIRERRTRMFVVVVAAAALVAALLTAYALGTRRSAALAERRGTVAEIGSQVMPFDLERTTHEFTDQADGGVETVVAEDPSDAQQITLIQQHLREEAEAFAEGDFSDPATIHGNDMPGLDALSEGGIRIDVRYEALVDGARITFSTNEPDLVAALHDWFAAQRGDHAEHG